MNCTWKYTATLIPSSATSRFSPFKGDFYHCFEKEIVENGNKKGKICQKKEQNKSSGEKKARREWNLGNEVWPPFRFTSPRRPSESKEWIERNRKRKHKIRSEYKDFQTDGPARRARPTDGPTDKDIKSRKIFFLHFEKWKKVVKVKEGNELRRCFWGWLRVGLGWVGMVWIFRG